MMSTLNRIKGAQEQNVILRNFSQYFTCFFVSWYLLITKRKVKNRANSAWERKNAVNSIWWWVFRAIIWEIKRKAQRMILQRPAVYYTFMGASLGKLTLARFLDKIFPHWFSRCWTCTRKNKMIKVIALFQNITCLILSRRESLHQLNYQQNHYILFSPLRFSLWYKNINTWYFKIGFI